MTEAASAQSAERIAALAPRDRLMRHLGAELVSGGAGCASVRMHVREEHLNFLDGCHGGSIFALADAAFGFACNSSGAATSAIHASIAFTRPVRLGDVLTASAAEISRSRRVSNVRVEVRCGDGALVATFHGTAMIRDDAPKAER